MSVQPDTASIFFSSPSRGPLENMENEQNVVRDGRMVEVTDKSFRNHCKNGLKYTRMPVATIADLPVELVEKIAHDLEVKDVVKLMMVNKRLYAMQSIMFGRHVAGIALKRYSNWIKKFVDSLPWEVNAARLPFVKRIDSCDKLDVDFCVQRRFDGMFLDQLKSVNQLEFHVDRKERCLTFLNNFYGSVKKQATLNIRIGSFKQEQTMKELLGKFIENQLNGCEKITLNCDFKDCFHVYHEAMMKTKIKMIQITTCAGKFDQILYLIVNQRIPSKNSEAVIHIRSTREYTVYNRASAFFSQMQGFQRVDGRKKLALVSRANKLLRENFSFGSEEGFLSFNKNSPCFRRQIDPTTSCIYVLDDYRRFLQFLAFYMPSE